MKQITQPTYQNGFIGGIIIGMSSCMFLYICGRIAGISGVISGIIDNLTKNKKIPVSKYAFFIGFLLSGLYWCNFSSLLPKSVKDNSFTKYEYDPIIMIIAGILVGIGTRIGNGCTSGHGVAGLGRRSVRSIVAVLCFMTTGIIATKLSEIHLYDFYNYEYSKRMIEMNTYLSYIIPTILISILIAKYKQIQSLSSESFTILLPGLLSGFIFSTGLVISGMTNSEKVRNFLNMNINFNNLTKYFDPTLMFVLGGAVSMTLVLYPFILSSKKPLSNNKFYLPSPTGKVDYKLILGSSLFGIGWGIGGVCPGPGLVLLTSFEYGISLWFWLFGLIIGMISYHKINTIL